MRDSQDAKIDYKDVSGDLVGFELQAFSHLFARLAPDPKFTAKIDKKPDRLIAFRDDLLHLGYGGKERDTVPPEITQDEYQVVRRAVLEVRKNIKKGITNVKDHGWLKSQLVACELNAADGTEVKIIKPFPVPPISDSWITDIETRISTPNEHNVPSLIAKEIVARRLGIGFDTVVRQCKEGLRAQGDRTLTRPLLASCFLELNVTKDRKAQARILVCLLCADYPKFKLYYLVQISHSIDWPMTLVPWSQEMISRLCKTICPDDKRGPFIEVCKSLQQDTPKRSHP